MNTNKSTTGIDPKVKLSLLWIFVVLLMALCGYCFFNGTPTSAIRVKNGGGSDVCGIFAGRRDRHDNFDGHGYPVLGIDLQGKSLGNHHYWCIHDCKYCYRRAWFVLCAV